MTKTKALLLASALGVATPVAAEDITASIWFPETHPMTSEGYMALKDTIEDASGGELTTTRNHGKAPPSWSTWLGCCARCPRQLGSRLCAGTGPPAMPRATRGSGMKPGVSAIGAPA